ncbi:MAG: hypothetical protein AMK69_27550 [Nitrospira bacterium SG8_3]|jgi:hypothetical protein|nr:MAG: hypothetical protein AMK69_27550 [Nitrospira bacterium SG8_3]
MTARLVRAFVVVILCLSCSFLAAGEEANKIQQKGKNVCERSSQLTKEEGANMLKWAPTHRALLLH